MGCKFLNPDGSFQRYLNRFPDLPTVFFCFTHLGIFFDKVFFHQKYAGKYFYSDNNFEEIEKIDQPAGTFIVMPRSILEKIGVFDERFIIFFNDVDLCKRTWNAGLEIHFLPHISITHYGGGGIKQLGLKAYNWYFVTGCCRYFQKASCGYTHRYRDVFFALDFMDTARKPQAFKPGDEWPPGAKQ